MLNPFIGTIMYFGFDFAPDGYLKCDGNVVPIKGKESLFGLIGTTYGGDGKTNFGMPNMKGRRMMGQQVESERGKFGGNAQVTMQLANLASHTHSIDPVPLGVDGSGNVGTFADPTNNFYAKYDGGDVANYSSAPGNDSYAAELTVTVSSTGSAVPIKIENPYLALTCCIAYAGIYPSQG